jgi:hypothetical protein
MLKKLINKFGNTPFIQWMKELNLDNFNILGIFTVLKKVLKIINNDKDGILQGCYMLIMIIMLFCYVPHEPWLNGPQGTNEYNVVIFIGWLLKIAAWGMAFFALPIIVDEYDKQ